MLESRDSVPHLAICGVPQTSIGLSITKELLQQAMLLGCLTCKNNSADPIIKRAQNHYTNKQRQHNYTHTIEQNLKEQS